jgi:hypothetical protein
MLRHFFNHLLNNYSKRNSDDMPNYFIYPGNSLILDCVKQFLKTAFQPEFSTNIFLTPVLIFFCWISQYLCLHFCKGLKKSCGHRQLHLPSPFLLTFRWTGMENQFLFWKYFFLENKTRKSKVVKLHLISGEPVSIFN